jgi:3-oxoacyl-[acyl-carrier protein] reductase
MSLDLSEKKVLITGSTDGLGKALAIKLSQLGSKIIIHGRNEEKAKDVISQLEGEDHRYIICDFKNLKDIEKNLANIKELDILINNTGVWDERNTTDVEVEKIVEMVNVNTTSYLIASKVLLPVLTQSEYSQILNIISIAGVEIPFDYYHTVYSATKFALQGYSEALEKEYTNKNVRVMGFYQGGMNTNIFDKAGMNYKHPEPWMFDVQEAVDTIVFMLTRNKKVNIKRLDLINHLEV